MDSVFLRFESYDFESDEKFQEGVKILHNNDNTEKRQDMKLFFYNRFVEPIDRDGYKEWRTASSLETEQRTSPSVSDSDLSQNRISETPTETEARQLSFSEVMQLIQEGKEVPGAKTLEVQPSNQSPTPAAMERRLKPWETASSSH